LKRSLKNTTGARAFRLGSADAFPNPSTELMLARLRSLRMNLNVNDAAEAPGEGRREKGGKKRG
jgi:hypothetical protein